MGSVVDETFTVISGHNAPRGALHHDAYLQAYTLGSHHALTVAARKRAA